MSTVGWAAIAASAGVVGALVALFGLAPRVYPANYEAAVEDLATILTATPNLRAKFFADPTKEIGKQLPARKYWAYRLQTAPFNLVRSWRELRATRAALAQDILCRIARDVRDGKLSSTINTDAVFAEFFAPIVRVSQRSFYTVFALSWGTFLAGLVLIGFGVYIAAWSPGDTDSTVVGSVFGGSGAIAALGSVYAMAKQGIREATVDHARLRIVLTAFATQLGQLRALAERPPDEGAEPPEMSDIQAVNAAIAESTAGALDLVPPVFRAR